MKILKKLFLVSLFFSLFVVNASALNTYNYDINNSDVSASEYVYQNVNRIIINNNISIDFQNECNNLYSSYHSDYDYYFCSLTFDSYDNIILSLKVFNEISYPIRLRFFKSSNDLAFGLTGISSGNLPYYQYKYNFSSKQFVSYSNGNFSFGSFDYFNISNYDITSRKYGFNVVTMPLFTLVNTNYNDNISIVSQASSTNVNINISSTIYGLDYETNLPLYGFLSDNFKKLIGYKEKPKEPTYSYSVEPSNNENYKVNFKFENYDNENTNYRFSLLNKFSQESFGDENSYKNYCFYDIEDLYNTIPFGNEYSIEVDNSTFLELKLYRYDKIDECYEEIEVKNEFIDVNMINNSYFETEPNFVVDRIEYNVLSGHFENLPQGPNFSSLNICSYSFSNNPDNKIEFNCQEKVDIEFEHNGYISVSLTRNNMTLYNRKINVSGGSIDKPKILYDVENNIGYSNIKWSINNQNYSNNIAYRYSLNNGLMYHPWTLINSDNFEDIIKVTQTNKVILEIKDNETNEIFDSVVIPINIGYSSTIVDNVDLDNYQNLIGYLPPGPVDSILNLPLSFLKSLSKSLAGVCNPVKITLPFVESDIELPCQSDFYEKIGATSFFNYVGVIASTIIFYSYLVYLYKWVDRIMHLENIEVIDWGSKL